MFIMSISGQKRIKFVENSNLLSLLVPHIVEDFCRLCRRYKKFSTYCDFLWSPLNKFKCKSNWEFKNESCRRRIEIQECEELCITSAEATSSKTQTRKNTKTDYARRKANSSQHTIGDKHGQMNSKTKLLDSTELDNDFHKANSTDSVDQYKFENKNNKMKSDPPIQINLKTQILRSTELNNDVYETNSRSSMDLYKIGGKGENMEGDQLIQLNSKNRILDSTELKNDLYKANFRNSMDLYKIEEKGEKMEGDQSIRLNSKNRLLDSTELNNDMGLYKKGDKKEIKQSYQKNLYLKNTKINIFPTEEIANNFIETLKTDMVLRKKRFSENFYNRLSKPKKLDVCHLNPDWTLTEAIKNFTPSQRLLDISQPKVNYNKYLPVIEQSTVKKSALQYTATQRILELAIPANRYLLNCENEQNNSSHVSPAALTAKLTEAVAQLAIPKVRLNHHLRKNPYSVRRKALKARTSRHIKELALPKGSSKHPTN